MRLSIWPSVMGAELKIIIFKYKKMGKPIVEESKDGDWFLVKGQIKKGFRKIYVNNLRKLSV